MNTIITVNGQPRRAHVVFSTSPLVQTCCACADLTPLPFGAWYCPACKHGIRALEETMRRILARPPRRLARRAHARGVKRGQR